MNIYELSKLFWDFAFENPDKIKPNHIAIYFFAVEHCNRLGWKEKFGLPASMTLEAIGMKSYNTYKNTFDDLVDYGFFKVIQYSKNQYSANIIALKENVKANSKARTKATIKHDQKQNESIDSIDIPDTLIPSNQIPDTADLGNPPPKVLTDYEVCVSIWKKLHPDFVFNATSGKKMKSIIEKIKNLLKSRGKEVRSDTIIESFATICKKMPEWFRNKDLSKIDSSFNEIIEEIKNPTKNATADRFTKHAATTSEVIAKLKGSLPLDQG